MIHSETGFIHLTLKTRWHSPKPSYQFSLYQIMNSENWFVWPVLQIVAAPTVFPCGAKPVSCINAGFASRIVVPEFSIISNLEDLAVRTVCVCRVVCPVFWRSGKTWCVELWATFELRLTSAYQLGCCPAHMVNKYWSAWIQYTVKHLT